MTFQPISRLVQESKYSPQSINCFFFNFDILVQFEWKEFRAHRQLSWVRMEGFGCAFQQHFPDMGILISGDKESMRERRGSRVPSLESCSSAQWISTQDPVASTNIMSPWWPAFSVPDRGTILNVSAFVNLLSLETSIVCRNSLCKALGNCAELRTDTVPFMLPG